MVYREIIALYSGIHTKHSNTLCGQKYYLSVLIFTVHEVTTCMNSVVAIYRLFETYYEV